MRKNKFFLITMVAFLGIALSAESLSSKLEAALKTKNMKAVRELLLSAPASEKTKFEKTIINAAKQSVRSGDLDYAKNLAEVVLISNQDNVEAQDLYSSIVEMQKNQKKLDEQKKQMQAEAEAKAKAEADEKARITAAEQKEKDKEALYKSVYEVDLKNFYLDASLGPSFSIFGSSFADKAFGRKKTNSDIGVLLGFHAGFVHPYVLLKLGLNLNWLTVAMAGKDLSVFVVSRFAIGTNAAGGVPIFLSTGHSYINYYGKGGGEQASMLYTKISSPFVGLSVEDWHPIEKLGLTFKFNWIPISVTSPFMSFGMHTNIGATYEFWKNHIMSLRVGSDMDIYAFTAKKYADWNLIPNIYVNAIFHVPK
ncbi:hypothetical protein E4O03_03080 [Treponema sp. OMZ 792]|uniref:hypothetical protein n=1 Tax=unclassified Treponema TaxID=2638727 RepID=UPI0020A2691D|nr:MULTISPECIES: hypothetical protein [unclassified Treponema]UTC75723.1 hypothetical protein E4O03_03080 [Treponema sp. OMZ 792]UTC79722.1 hypothetical protein E4O07_03090 [Treponema sp. OMZ 798]